MSFENLEALTRLGIPDSGRFVSAAGEETVPLGIEGNLQATKKKMILGLCNLIPNFFFFFFFFCFLGPHTRHMEVPRLR